MNSVKQTSWIFLLLVFLSGSGWYFAKNSLLIESVLDETVLMNTTDITIYDLEMRQYDTAGKLTQYLKSPLVRHIPKDNTHWLKTPFISLAQEGHTNWTIQSMQAISLKGGEQVTFLKNVIMHQEPSDKNTESTFKTEKIVYFPKKKLATTQHKVVLVQPSNTIESTGMRADLDKKHVQLLSQAKGTYEGYHG